MQHLEGYSQPTQTREGRPARTGRPPICHFAGDKDTLTTPQRRRQFLRNMATSGDVAKQVLAAVNLPKLNLPDDLGPHGRVVVSRLSSRFITYIMWSEPREIRSGKVCPIGIYDTVRGALLSASATSHRLGRLPIIDRCEENS